MAATIAARGGGAAGGDGEAERQQLRRQRRKKTSCLQALFDENEDEICGQHFKAMIKGVSAIATRSLMLQKNCQRNV